MADLSDVQPADIPVMSSARSAHTLAAVDPQVFVSSSGVPAGIGPQKIAHTADLAPAPKSSSADTPLLAADGTPLNITLGQWENATGTVSLSCANNIASATHKLRGLVPFGLYSVFVVHLNIQGPERFTPFGDTEGTTNNFTAGLDGDRDADNNPYRLSDRSGRRRDHLAQRHPVPRAHRSNDGR